MVEILSDQFDWRLGAVGLLFGHVEIVDEDDAFFADWWTVVSFTSFLHLGVDGVLGLIGASLCREGQRDILISIRHACCQEFAAVERFTSTSRPQSQHMVVMGQQHLDQMPIPD